jgi:hypothetical protein
MSIAPPPLFAGGAMFTIEFEETDVVRRAAGDRVTNVGGCSRMDFDRGPR